MDKPGIRRDLEDTVRGLLSRRDPNGFYVILALNNSEAKNAVSGFLRGRDILIEEYGDLIVIRCKSRSVAERIAKTLLSRGLLKIE